MLKRARVLFFALLMCFCVGCNNEFAKEDYDSTTMIAQEGDRYAKEGSIFNPIEGGYSFTVSKFDGRQTLWREEVKEEQEIPIDFTFTLSKGQAKVVHVDKDGNVTTVLECTPETVASGSVTKTILLKKGDNRIKVVGFDCKDMKLIMLFKDGQ